MSGWSVDRELEIWAYLPTRSEFSPGPTSADGLRLTRPGFGYVDTSLGDEDTHWSHQARRVCVTHQEQLGLSFALVLSGGQAEHGNQ